MYDSSIKEALLGNPNIQTLLFLVPELKPTVGCEQNHPGHYLDVFTHTLKVVEQLPMDLTLRLAALLHDIGKPEMKVLGKDGFDHFGGHEEVGAQKAKAILERFDINKGQKDTICQLIRLHDSPIAKNRNEMECAIEQYGCKFIDKLLILQQADLLAHAPEYCVRKLLEWEAVNILFQLVIKDSTTL
ncbi:MAG: HD domain-containing protein [Syntrophomonas sp.]